MNKPLVGLVMGSDSDWVVMQHAAHKLEEFGVAYESKVVSAHRTPKEHRKRGSVADEWCATPPA